MLPAMNEEPSATEFQQWMGQSRIISDYTYIWINKYPIMIDCVRMPKQCIRVSTYNIGSFAVQGHIVLVMLLG